MASACQVPFLGPSADQLLRDGLRNFDSAQVREFKNLHVEGTKWRLGANGAPPQLEGDLQLDPNGDGRGSLGSGNSHLETVTVGGVTYVKAPALVWHDALSSLNFAKLPSPLPAGVVDDRVTKVLGDRWTIAPEVGDLHADATALAHLASLHAGSGRLTKGDTSRVQGASAVKISTAQHVDAYVTTTQPIRLVRIAYAPGFVDADGHHDLRSDIITHPGQPDATPPADAVNVDDPNTLPARFQEVRGTRTAQPTDTCNQNSCTVKADVRNIGGKSAGQSTATFMASERPAGQNDLGSCQVNIPAIANGQSETVTCAFSSPAWTNFVTTVHTGMFNLAMKIKDPVWDD